MALYGLADTSISGVELHLADNSSLLLLDAYNNHPFCVDVDSIVDDLATLFTISRLPGQQLGARTYDEVGVALKNLNRRSLCLVKDIPVEDC